MVCRDAFCRNWILSKIAGTPRMVRGPKYDGKYLHSLLRQYLGDRRLDKCGHPDLRHRVPATHDFLKL